MRLTMWRSNPHETTARSERRHLRRHAMRRADGGLEMLTQVMDRVRWDLRCRSHRQDRTRRPRRREPTPRGCRMSAASPAPSPNSIARPLPQGAFARTISIQCPVGPHAYSSLLNHNNVLHAPTSLTSPHDIADNIVLAFPPFRTRRLGRVIAPCGPDGEHAQRYRAERPLNGAVSPPPPSAPRNLAYRPWSVLDRTTRVPESSRGLMVSLLGHAATTLFASPFLGRRSPDPYCYQPSVQCFLFRSGRHGRTAAEDL
ncbi:hypothetical protein OH76DRAFT_509252 [Lentinus brumalis]|uniref:Uncharacterized protein n=1 Tax=Lentinus brumalis TaxID=2498619 RepID=A0A371DB16_9APHY|nr:hypothetical protein OH76DRAFT_509252 [Polyporus brumalis]